MDLHPKMAAMLKEYIGDRKSGLLFPTRSGKPLGQSNVLRRTLHPILEELGEPQCGAHAFRRFRLTHIREHGVPKDLEHFWMGHEDEEIGDIYSMLKQRVAYRKKWADQLGLGFEIPSKTISFGPNGPKIESRPVSELAATA
jgi:integrase